MDTKEHICCLNKSQENCRKCINEDRLLYWCQVCNQAVAEKRCPMCGLKARRMRQSGGEGQKG